MNKTKNFIKLFINKAKEDSINETANALTYKLLLSLFPLIIFIMSLLGYFELDHSFLLTGVNQNLPDEIKELINIFISEVIDTKSPSLLSTSLIVALVSASSGFDAIIKGVNKSYHFEDERNPIVVKLYSLAIVFIFSAVIIFSSVMFLFSTEIKKAMLNLNISITVIGYIFSFTTYAITIVILIFITSAIFKLACGKKLTIFKTLPGACITVALWVITSKLFNIYISNFSRYSKVYGSIGSIFVLMLWINLISFSLLVGNEINAIILSKIHEKNTNYIS